MRRRRECSACNGRFTTFERAELSMPQVLKRSGDPEPFDEHKLRRGMEHALYKRAVSPEAVDQAMAAVMRRLRESGEREVHSQRVGELVMEQLHDLDQVAYVRFASIYRAFADVNAFRDEIERMENLPSAALRRSQLSLIENEVTPPRAARRPRSGK